MPCDRLARVLDDYFDGALGAVDAEDLRAHAGQCPECGALHAAERQLRRALAALPVAAPEAGFFERALGVAIRRRRRGERLPGSLGPVAVLAIAAALMVWLAGRHG